MNRQLSFGKNKASAGGKQWVHPAEALLKGHIVYNVKFLGHVEVDEPKGIEVVKDAIRKMKFNKDLKKAEGQKPPKVELTVSVDGLTVQEPKYKVIQHKYPLHRISYCADDKSDKRMFTFIAKEADGAQHHCFVFYSEKCAEEITLTIGQAFDLAYKKFMESSTKDMDMKKQFLLLQKKVQSLTQENLDLKARVADLERLVDPAKLEEFDKNKESILAASGSPPRHTAPVVGRRLENLMMPDDATYAQPQTNGHASVSASAPPGGHMPFLAPPPPVPPRNNMGSPGFAPTPAGQPAPGGMPVDLFGAQPFSPAAGAPGGPAGDPFAGGDPFATGGRAADPFGMPSFTPSSGPSSQDLDKQLMNMDRELMDLQSGFSAGLSMGTEDFSLDELDPLKK